ncbi:fungal-specific transcription factor domain-containing protein [Aspergillus pseudotamarii]|uniref:Fungal-specific transcription factor domain-containing protein n=1 Tax=Aspergillus pseudotamarii TaxID=132259 RepID=A0A5N6SI45_ASPPS|nr:fungal-specific transcription factor domain-containing protein [Aspergillus pseudotamarii]KAE8133577.1 fungal-specific transcription factor domain-containing protein [Aspergillus pseudotamarii]
MSTADGRPPASRQSKIRQRVSVACVLCRMKRIRCDGAEPCCGPCQQRNLTCEYQHTENKRKPPSKKFVRSLQARIELLEQELAALGRPVPCVPETSVEAVVESDTETEDGVNQPRRINPLEEISGMTARLNVSTNGELWYFGTLSNYNLLHGRLHEVSAEPLALGRAGDFSPITRFNNGQGISQELQDHLLDLYWKWQNPWNYVIHKDAFMQDYAFHRSGKYCTPLLLLAIFALAARYSDRREVRAVLTNPKTAGEIFAREAKILLQEGMETPTVPTVQAAVLLGLNAMAEDRESLGWLFVGMAMRMAFNLGLNLDCSNWVTTAHMSELDAEVRKVAWWGCYTLDKLFSLGHGRPGMTRKYDISCPKPNKCQTAEFGPWIPWSTSDQTLANAPIRIVSTSSYVIELLGIATDALDVVYAPNSELRRPELEGIITRTDIALHQFYRDIPSFLRLPVSIRMPCLPHIYQLHIQYHVIQILLHRPLIAKRRISSRVLLDSQESNTHLQTCRHSASEVTKLLRTYQDHYTLRLTPIVTVHSTFTAAIIHLMDATSTTPLIRRRGISNLRICLDALETMSLAWCWSCRAIRALRILAYEWLTPEAVRVENLARSIPSATECHLKLQPLEPTSVEQVAPTESIGAVECSDPTGPMDMETIRYEADSSFAMDPLLEDNLDWLLRTHHDYEREDTEQGAASTELNSWITSAAQSTFAVPRWDEFTAFSNVWHHLDMQPLF